MPIKVHRPPVIENTEGPNIFLAGPIQGAPNWQAEAEAHLDNALPLSAGNVNVFNPRALDMSHSKQSQIGWEKKALVRARNFGILVYWFAAQDFSISDYPEGRPYAQTSRIEFGRAVGWKDLRPSVKIGIGIDPSYAGGNEEYITSCADEHSLKIYRNLGQLCSHVIELGQAE